MSVVINSDSSVLENFVQIREKVTTITGTGITLTVEYKCTDETFVGLEVVSDVISDISTGVALKIFQKIWRCRKTDEIIGVKSKRVRLKLPPEIAYNYNAFNKLVKFTSRTKVRVWIVDKDWWPYCFRHSNCYTRSFVKMSHDVQISPPFSRPYYRPYRQCKTWGWHVISILSSYHIPKCPYEQETLEAIKYPLVLGGDPYGVYRQFSPYRNPELETKRRSQLSRPRFTISTWLYILEYCPGPPRGRLCSIMHHFTWNGEFRTFMVLLTPEGRVHIQIQDVEGYQTAGVTHFSIPKHRWIRLIIQFHVQTWRLIVNSGENFKETQETEFRHPRGPAFYDDTKDLFTFGGSEYMPSFKGYIGQATIYRNRVLEPQNIPMPSRFHPMFELKLTRREEKCAKYLQWVNGRIEVQSNIYKRFLQKLTCRNPFVEMIELIISQTKSINVLPTCPRSRENQKRYRKYIDDILRRMVFEGNAIDFNQLADRLYQNATVLLEGGMEHIPEVFPVLKQAACLGNMDAMYMVSVILNNGLYMKADEIQSQAYLMLAALENHRLSALALGNKHRYGIDGVTEDLEQSYRYYKFVADTTNADRVEHKDTDVYTESIRLTDEVAIHEQTDEDGDIFHWLSHQAKQGVLSAQNKIGRALFWGQQGLKRNLASAVEYFKMSAETGDAQSQYDYGIVLMRGQGVKKNVEAGLQQLQKAAQQENPAALNAIGWHAMTFEKNMTKAAEQYEKAFQLGSPDAAYNLGILYLYGTYPGKEMDADKALEYFIYAGSRGQIDGGVAIAYQKIKGTSRQSRDVYTAVEWARFIAEKNPSIGLVLRKALQAYRKGKRDVGLFYYTLSADAGLEVGSFNTAWLCEENKDGVTSFIEKECVWSRYNMSTQREPQFVDPYALLKMGDYYWYGCKGVQDANLAAIYYAAAAKKRDPQALFNLGFMIEEGADISEIVLRDVGVPRHYTSNNISVLEYLYTKCKESRNTEAFLPCSLALWRVQAMDLWTKYHTIIKLTGFTGMAAMIALSTYVFLHGHFRGQAEVTNNI